MHAHKKIFEEQKSLYFYSTNFGKGKRDRIIKLLLLRVRNNAKKSAIKMYLLAFKKIVKKKGAF